VRIGGGFTQDYQALSHSNSADYVPTSPTNATNKNQLIGLANGFNLAMANLMLDAQLYDGIRLNITMYLSSRHHSETWVKAGYIQFDKLTFLKSGLIDSAMKYLTLRVGDLEVDYGDQHFRRTDGGNSMYNPFVENYIMDEFATEIGAELYYHSKKSGWLAMGGMTNGQLDPSVEAPTAIDSATGESHNYTPAFHAKVGFDKQLTKDFRWRLTGSFYGVKTSNNTLFNGDRTGSHYFSVMENTASSSGSQAWSGRYNPNFKQEVYTFMFNTLLKYKGLEFFGTFEMANGRTNTEKSMRQATQFAGDLIYRFPANKETFWVAARYNAVTAADKANNNGDITIQRVTGSVGMFFTKNIMAKLEYVNQGYHNFVSTDIRSGGSFQGGMLSAVIGF